MADMSWNDLRLAGQEAFENGQYELAEKHWVAAFDAAKSANQDGLEVAATNLDLANLYAITGRARDAEDKILDAIRIREQQLGQKDLQVADCLNLLAKNYAQQGRLNESHELYHDALKMREATLGHDHPDVADSYQELALFIKRWASEKNWVVMFQPLKSPIC
jgi:tetratricopeptide (TPR) repeat protein